MRPQVFQKAAGCHAANIQDEGRPRRMCEELLSLTGRVRNLAHRLHPVSVHEHVPALRPMMVAGDDHPAALDNDVVAGADAVVRSVVITGGAPEIDRLESAADGKQHRGHDEAESTHVVPPSVETRQDPIGDGNSVVPATSSQPAAADPLIVLLVFLVLLVLVLPLALVVFVFSLALAPLALHDVLPASGSTRCSSL